MRLPRFVRTTPFRLTLLFLALFAGAASVFVGYIYIATAGEANRSAEAAISREAHSLEEVYAQGGFNALNEAVIERSSSTRGFLYLVMDSRGQPVSGDIAKSPLVAPPQEGDKTWVSFGFTETEADGAVQRRPARGMEERLPGGELLFVGADIGEAQAYVVKVRDALLGAAALVIVLGLAGGVFVARDVARNMSALNDVI
ncbi:MAG TPA: histidine kinase, partial [Caulobacteraceae bacterium]|nr:histidine kinase [Caulobacteraceae bacterium]